MPPRKKKGGKPSSSSSTPSKSPPATPAAAASSSSSLSENKDDSSVIKPKPLTTDHGKVIVQKQCIRCSKPAKSFCGKCKFVWYCSGSCQTKDWKLGHRTKCSKIIALTTSDIITDDPSLEASIATALALKWEESERVGEEPELNLLPPPSKILYPPSSTAALWSQPRAPVRTGLINRGQCCFANVVLQCLTHTPQLQNWLTSAHHTRECTRGASGLFCMACLLQGHVTQAVVGGPAFLPIPILKALKHINDTFSLGAQEDAHEFYRCVLRGMHDAAVRVAAPPPSTSGFSSAPPQALSSWTLETDLIHQLFGGYLRSQLKCKCGAVSNSFESMLDLSLEIHEATDTLQETLEAFTVPEKLDEANKYRCNKCGQSVRAEKRLTVHQAPNLLTIQLKRFRLGVFGKVNRPVAFPFDLNLRPYMSLSQVPESAEPATAAVDNKEGSPSAEVTAPTDPYQYRLYAVIQHLDLMNISSFGHYVCYIRDSSRTPTGDGVNDPWLRLDDDRVELTSLPHVLAQKNAYMLFYERIRPQLDGYTVPPPPTAASTCTETLAAGSSAAVPQPSSSSDSKSESKAEHSSLSSSSSSLTSQPPPPSSSSASLLSGGRESKGEREPSPDRGTDSKSVRESKDSKDEAPVSSSISETKRSSAAAAAAVPLTRQPSPPSMADYSPHDYEDIDGYDDSMIDEFGIGPPGVLDQRRVLATLARLQKEAEMEQQREEAEQAAEAAKVQQMLDAAVRANSSTSTPAVSCANHCGHYGRADQENMCSKCFALKFPDRYRQMQQIKNLTRTQQQIETAMKRAQRRKELEQVLLKLKQDKAAGLPTPSAIAAAEEKEKERKIELKRQKSAERAAATAERLEKMRATQQAAIAAVATEPSTPSTPKVSTITPKNAAKLKPNDLCWCGNGKKFKKCHQNTK